MLVPAPARRALRLLTARPWIRVSANGRLGAPVPSLDAEAKPDPQVANLRRIPSMGTILASPADRPMAAAQNDHFGVRGSARHRFHGCAHIGGSARVLPDLLHHSA